MRERELGHRGRFGGSTPGVRAFGACCGLFAVVAVLGWAVWLRRARSAPSAT